MHFLDYTAISIYLLLILALGFYFGRNQSRKEFFVAGGSMGWLAVGLSVMATLFSSNSFVFFPSAAFGNSLRIGMVLVAFSLMTPVLVWVFIPVFSRLNLETAYEYLEKRFHVSVRTMASGLFIFLRIGWMAAATYAAALVVANVSGVSQNTVILGLGVIAIGYTMLGGLRAVMWTDVIQFFVFSITIVVALFIVVAQTDSSVGETFRTYSENREGLIIDFEWSITLQYGSWALLVGYFLESLSAFGADQVAVQRYLSARDERTSKIGAIINLIGLWIVVPGLLMIGVGLFGYFSENPSEIGTGPLAETLAADPKIADEAFPHFVRLHFPPGMAGLFLASLMAAIMSSIDSGIHSVTTALVVDFRDRLFPGLKPKSEKNEIRAIRLVLVGVGIFAVGLACFVGPLGNVFDIAKKLTAAFGGPLLALFILAFFFKRANSFGVFLSALISTAITLTLMLTMSDWFSVWFWPIGFGIAMFLGVVLSYLRPAKDSEYTFWKIIKKS